MIWSLPISPGSNHTVLFLFIASPPQGQHLPCLDLRPFSHFATWPVLSHHFCLSSNVTFSMKDSSKHSPELDLVGCLLSLFFFFFIVHSTLWNYLFVCLIIVSLLPTLIRNIRPSLPHSPLYPQALKSCLVATNKYFSKSGMYESMKECFVLLEPISSYVKHW